MIKRITLENFFSFSEATTIELNPGVNILVGINGSGKSNFLKAIRFLYESISGQGMEKLFLKEWGGFNTVANFNESKADTIKLIYEFDAKDINRGINNQTFKFSGKIVYEITIHKSGVSSYYLEEKLYKKLPQTNTQIFHYISIKNGKGNILTSNADGTNGREHYPQEKGGVSFKEQELVLRQIADPNRFLTLHILKLAIDSLAGYDYFDTTPDSKIRQKGFDGIESRLLPSGENLVQLLNRIKNHHSLDYEEIESKLNKVNPNFKDIGFELFGNNFYLTLREKKLAKTVGIGQISDGTLRFLLLLSIFINPERGNLVCIDEPETGLHPDMINTIAEIIKKASATSQLIIATHSPQLLNSFEIDDILIFEKDDNNKTIVARKTEDDFEHWSDDFLVGQLWLRGKIGGKRW